MSNQPHSPAMWIKTLTLLLPLLAAGSIQAQPVKADQPTEKTQDELFYTVSALAEMFFPMQLLACQAYPELRADSESWLKKLPYDPRNDPDKLPSINKLQQCFAVEPPLTRQQCATISDTMAQLEKAGGAWTSAQRQPAQTYLTISKQTLPALKASTNRCLARPEEHD